MRDSFSIYRSTFDALMAFPPEELKETLRMIGRYAMDDEEPDESIGVAYGMFLSVRPLIDRSHRRSDAGKAGGEANGSKPEANGSKREANPKQNEATVKQMEANVKQTRSKTKQTGSKGEIRNKKGEIIKDICVGHFVPPTLDEVRQYCKESNHHIDADKFVDFYTSKGWMVGKNKMKDWKAAVRNWERSSRQGKATNSKFNNFQSSGADWDDLAYQIMDAQEAKRDTNPGITK